MYNVEADARMKTFYYSFVKVSRILNKREHITEDDYNLLKWMLSTTNRKIELTDTANYDIEIPQKKGELDKIKQEIEDNTKVLDEFSELSTFEPIDGPY